MLRRNVVPTKMKGTRIIKGKKYYYVGQTQFRSKAQSIALELSEKRIGAAVTRRKDLGYLVWSTKPTYVDMSEEFNNPTSNPKKVDVIVRHKQLSKQDKRSLLDLYGQYYRVHSADMKTPKGDLIAEILEAEGLTIRRNPKEKTTLKCNFCGKEFKRVIGPRTYEIECPSCHETDVEVISNPMVEVDRLAVDAKGHYQEDIKAGHADGANYWAGAAGSAYLMSNPGSAPRIGYGWVLTDSVKPAVAVETGNRYLGDNHVCLVKNKNKVDIWISETLSSEPQAKMIDLRQVTQNPTRPELLSLKAGDMVTFKTGQKLSDATVDYITYTVKSGDVFRVTRKPARNTVKIDLMSNGRYAGSYKALGMYIETINSQKNPIMATIGTAMLSGVGLGAGFKVVDSAVHKFQKGH